MMTASEMRTAFLQLSPERKTRVVALLAHNMTIAARCAYPGQVEPRVGAGRLRIFNEMQHTITAKLMYLIAGDQRAFPDEGFLDVLFEKAQEGHCEADLIQAFEYSCAAKW
jgi:hypothetical protein